MIEIVGAIINNNVVTNSLRDIVIASKEGRIVEPLTRERMKFMSACDLGKNWDNMANGDTLFYQDNEGQFHKAS
ncbi:MAG: hypothetical protein KAJ39_01290 [Gammaproteobacteria bacterium]|nr:hypothetical protein [Gammaproteobacteria bacterium]